MSQTESTTPPSASDESDPIPTLHRVHFFTLVFVGIPVLASMMGNFNSLGWQFDYLHQFQLQFMYLGIFLFLLCGAVRNWFGARLAIALCLSALIGIWPTLGAYIEDAPPVTPGERLISYNVLSTNDDQRQIEAWLRGKDASLVALIEANYRWTDTLQRLRDLYPHQHLLDDLGNYGIALLSKYPLENVEQLRARQHFFSSISADVTLPIGRVRVVALHVPPPLSESYQAVRDYEIANLITPVNASPLPIVLMGDFNAVPWTKSLQVTTHGTRLTGLDFKASWPTWAGWMGIPIDFILGANGAVVSNHRAGPRQSSDHMAKIADLHLPATR